MNKIDTVLRNISKLQDLDKIRVEVHKVCTSKEDYVDTLLLLILRALTDKGFKSHASMLSQEYYNEEDLDGDGKIYGIDWVYENPPLLLKGLVIDEKIKDRRTFKPIR